MKINHPLFLAGLLTLAALPASAAFESIQIKAENDLPPFPITLVMQGITRGHALVAISVDENGRMHDSLVLGYTHERFAQAAVEALQQWHFTPARLDGQPVPAQTELQFDFTLEGAVITANIAENFLKSRFEGLADKWGGSRPGRPAELDRPPAKVSGGAPKYDPAAQQAGVHGKVLVRFYIDEQGRVRLPSLAVEADPYLAGQAVEAVRGWKFEAPTVHGKPVLIAVAQEFDFGGGK